MRQFFLIVATVFASTSIGWAQVHEAISEPNMKGELEAVYNAWRTAVAKKNLENWKKVTAPSRQIEVQNEIVSQKLEFPKALFDVPFSAPPLENLQFLDVFTRRVTATVVYFGKADFGIGNVSEVKENLIVLSFSKETNKWQFDRLRIVRIPPKSDIFGLIRVGDFSFLKGEEFQPLKELPPMPNLVGKPDYIAEIHVNSVGYASTVEVNGREVGTITNTSAKALVIGGLQKGLNSVEVKTKKLEGIDLGVEDRLEIAIYAVRSAKDEGQRAFHFLPTPSEIPEEKRLTFGMD